MVPRLAELPAACALVVGYHHTSCGKNQHGRVEALYIASVWILGRRPGYPVEIFDTSPAG